MRFYIESSFSIGFLKLTHLTETNLRLLDEKRLQIFDYSKSRQQDFFLKRRVLL